MTENNELSLRKITMTKKEIHLTEMLLTGLAINRQRSTRIPQ